MRGGGDEERRGTGKGTAYRSSYRLQVTGTRSAAKKGGGESAKGGFPPFLTRSCIATGCRWGGDSQGHFRNGIRPRTDPRSARRKIRERLGMQASA
jgi:hypothetical protein